MYDIGMGQGSGERKGDGYMVGDLPSELSTGGMLESEDLISHGSCNDSSSD